MSIIWIVHSDRSKRGKNLSCRVARHDINFAADYYEQTRRGRKVLVRKGRKKATNGDYIALGLMAGGLLGGSALAALILRKRAARLRTIAKEAAERQRIYDEGNRAWRQSQDEFDRVYNSPEGRAARDRKIDDFIDAIMGRKPMPKPPKTIDGNYNRPQKTVYQVEE